MGTVAEGEFQIINALGLHARAAAQLVKLANRFSSALLLECDGQQVNGKSIMGVLMLAAARGAMVKVRCEGEDAEVCLTEVKALIENRFGESQ
ncbi:MAG TPA: HPr family phosphocarrier protein [Myxococcaceae bacterium]|nr:HPr family phosphocarrier protein [Myxococcaceae bacterium]